MPIRARVTVSRRDHLRSNQNRTMRSNGYYRRRLSSAVHKGYQKVTKHVHWDPHTAVPTVQQASWEMTPLRDLWLIWLNSTNKHSTNDTAALARVRSRRVNEYNDNSAIIRIWIFTVESKSATNITFLRFPEVFKPICHINISDVTSNFNYKEKINEYMVSFDLTLIRWGAVELKISSNELRYGVSVYWF